MEIIWSRLAKETLVSIVDVEDSFNSIVALKVYNKISNHIDSLENDDFHCREYYF